MHLSLAVIATTDSALVEGKNDSYKRISHSAFAKCQKKGIKLGSCPRLLNLKSEVQLAADLAEDHVHYTREGR